MEPSITPGDFVMIQRRAPIRKGDVVVVMAGGMLMIKRVAGIGEGAYWVEGDNREESCDSRRFGWVSSESVLGRARVFHRPNWLTSGIL